MVELKQPMNINKNHIVGLQFNTFYKMIHSPYHTIIINVRSESYYLYFKFYLLNYLKSQLYIKFKLFDLDLTVNNIVTMWIQDLLDCIRSNFRIVHDIIYVSLWAVKQEQKKITTFALVCNTFENHECLGGINASKFTTKSWTS